MHLEYRHGNGHDSVILVSDKGLVRSDWTVTADVMKDFCDCSQLADDWDDRGGDEHKPADYGVMVAVRSGYALRAAKPQLWHERVEFFVH